ncbi:hypothetical protein AAY473_034350 [Plecturocebus cupreus]
MGPTEPDRPVYSAPGSAALGHRQNSHAGQKSRAGDPCGSSAKNLPVCGQQKFVGKLSRAMFLQDRHVGWLLRTWELEKEVDTLPASGNVTGKASLQTLPSPMDSALSESMTNLHWSLVSPCMYYPQPQELRNQTFESEIKGKYRPRKPAFWWLMALPHKSSACQENSVKPTGPYSSPLGLLALPTTPSSKPPLPFTQPAPAPTAQEQQVTGNSSVEKGFYQIGQAGLGLLTSGDPPTSASRSLFYYCCENVTWSNLQINTGVINGPKNGRGRHRQRTRCSVSRSSARGAFENKGGGKGVRGVLRRAAAEKAPPRKPWCLRPAQLTAGGHKSLEEARGGKAGGEGREPLPRTAPCPDRPGTASCSAPGSRGCARKRAPRGAAGLPNRPLASFRAAGTQFSTGAPGPTGHSPGATSGELTAPPTKTAAARAAAPGSARGAIAGSFRPPLPGRRVPRSGRLRRSRAGGRIEWPGSAPGSGEPRPATAPPLPRPLHTHFGSVPPLPRSPGPNLSRHEAHPWLLP